MTIMNRLQNAANGGWLTTDDIVTAIKPLATSCNIKLIISLLAPYKGSHQWRPRGGVYPDFTALLNASSAKFKNDIVQNNEDERVAGFIAVLAGMNRVIEGVGVVVSYGTAKKENSFNNIAEKFVKDHLVKNRKAGKTWAESRFCGGTLMSTAIDQLSYGQLFDTEVGKLNKLGVFGLVEDYLSRVKSWNPVNTLVNSICYVSRNRIQVVTYSKAQNRTDEATASGHLMYAVQKNESKLEQRLLYHYEDLLHEADNPGADWEVVELSSVLKKAAQGKALDSEALREGWPIIYYRVG